MSDNIPPFEIQAEILKRVSDVKSLLQFRSVSKSWKSLIDSPRFITGYHQSQPPRYHVFLWYKGHQSKRPDHFRGDFVSIIDNDDDSDSRSFGQHKFPLALPDPVKYRSGFEVYGSSKGLFFLYDYSWDGIEKGMAVLWNPTIRKSVTIHVPQVPYEYIIGFGVCPYSSDPKLVRIRRVGRRRKPRQAEIYSLSIGEWRTLSMGNLSRSSVRFSSSRFNCYRSSVRFNYYCHVAIGKYIFWHAKDRKYENRMLIKRQMIIIFDMTNDTFMEIYVPDRVIKDPYDEWSLHKIGESLAVVVAQDCHQVYHVWMMEGGVSDSFTKMYSIISPDATTFKLLAFRNNGHPIIKMLVSGEHVVYEPASELFIPMGASESTYTRCACSYMETLLLLDH